MHYDNIRVKASSVENGLKSQEELTKPLQYVCEREKKIPEIMYFQLSLKIILIVQTWNIRNM